MSTYVEQTAFEDPFTLTVTQRAEPQAGPGQVRVKVAVVGLNPLDWKIASNPGVAAAFGVTAPAGFGGDFAGTIDQVGDGVTAFAVGDRVFGSAGLGRAAAEHVILDNPAELISLTPEGLDDAVAGGLNVVARTADAALSTVAVKRGETVLIGGASGGVGIIAVQLAVAAGTRVIATASAANQEFLAGLGAIPTTYGEGLVDRVRALAPDGVDAALDLNGTETVMAAVALGVTPARIGTIAAGFNPPAGAQATGMIHASPDALMRIAEQVAKGEIVLPIEAEFPVDKIEDAVALLRGGHVRGKVIVRL